MNKYRNYTMTTSKKKTTRRKAYRNMSVTELVSARKELAEKIGQIDAILAKAVEAVQNAGVASPVSYNRPSVGPGGGYDPAFGNPNNYGQPQQGLAAQVAVSNEAPIMAPRPGNAPDQSSGFTIFDADAHARKQAEADQQYLVNNPGAPVPPEYDFNSEQVSSEIASLQQEIANSKANEGDTPTDTE